MTNNAASASASSAASNTPVAELAPIPQKLYFTIGEVAELCQIKPHVLRYWEREFTQLKPVKRRGNRRYYQRDDVLLVRQIQTLLHEQGYTISGAKQRLKKAEPTVSEKTAKAASIGSETLVDIRKELKAILKLLD